jgi:predicted nucleic acid-binding protein
VGGSQVPAIGTGDFDPREEWPAHPRRLLTAHVVFDTMVPCYLARANRVQMLREAFAGRAHIPSRVRGEISGLANAYVDLRVLLEPAPFADVHRLTREQAQRALDRQIAWNSRAVIEADPNRDRGEAEALALCDDHADWVIVSHDSNAIHNAKLLSIPILAAPDVLLVFAVQGRCLAANAWKIYETLIGLGMEPSRFWPDDDEARERFMDHARAFGLAV